VQLRHQPELHISAP